MGTFIDLLQGFGWGIFRLIVGISGLIVFTYFAFFLVRIVRGKRAAGVIRHSNIVGVMCLFFLTFIGLAFVSNALQVPGWESRGPRAIIFYLLIVFLTLMALFAANLTIWNVSFSPEYIIERRSFWRKKSLKWNDVACWYTDENSKSIILKMRDGGVFCIILADVDGARELFEALEIRKISRENLDSPTEGKA